MKYLFIMLIVVLYSCNGNKRDFFQSMEVGRPFLDTFSLFNLKDFGMSNKLVIKHGKSYYEFNNTNNSIYIEGFFRKENGKLFFLPKDSETELLFLDSHWTTSTQINPQQTTTKSNDVYDIRWMGLSYNSSLRDSIFNIQIEGDGIFNHPESLTFEVSKNFDILAIEYVNCKHDTLTINFFPKQKVHFKHINKSAACL